MEIALVEYFPGHGFEVWVTDLIEIGEGMGSVFDTREEALNYAAEHEVPQLDLTHLEMPNLEGNELRNFLTQYLELSPQGEIISIKENQ